jgi:hypothetical protein
VVGIPSYHPAIPVVNETLPRVLFLLRFLCFIAVVYLALHALFARLISKPDSKVLWFFSTLTAPLTWPIRVWLTSETSDARLRQVALVVYGIIWAMIVILTQIVSGQL